MRHLSKYVNFEIQEDSFLTLLSDDGMSKKSAYRNLRALHDFVELLNDMPIELATDCSATLPLCVITNRLPQRCGTETVIAFASARNSHHCNFFQVMRNLRLYLLQYFEQTKTVFIFSDIWAPERFRESQSELLFYGEKGVRIYGGLISAKQLVGVRLPYL